MAKISAVGSYIALDDSGGTVRNISNDISDIEINLPTNLLEVTGMDKSAPERIGGLQDSTVSLSGFFNPAANMSNAVLGTGRTTARTLTIVIGGNTTGNPQITGEYIIENYDVSFGDDRSATWSASLSKNDGVVQAWSTAS